jgi:hypothetical protein
VPQINQNQHQKFNCFSLRCIYPSPPRRKAKQKFLVFQHRKTTKKVLQAILNLLTTKAKKAGFL